MLSIARSIYAWLLLSVIMLPLFPTARLAHALTKRSDPQRAWLRVFVSRWVSLYARLSPLYEWRIEGLSSLPADRPYVLVANHESGLDVLALLTLKTPARFLAESRFFRIPLAGWLFGACRHIRVRPGDRESGQRALEEAERALGEGSPVAIFPEGVLSPDRLGELRPGAFVLAKRVGVPLVPVRLTGTGEAWRPGTLVVRGRHRITIRILEPIPADRVAAMTTEALIEHVRKTLEAAREAG